MTCPYSSKYGAPMLIATTIQEEEEEDLNDFPCPASSQQHISGNHAVNQVSDGSHGESSSAHGSRVQGDHRVFHLAVSAVARVASKFVNRVWHGQKAGLPHRVKTSSRSCLDGGNGSSATKAAPCKAAAQQKDCGSASSRPPSRKGSGGCAGAGVGANRPVPSDVVGVAGSPYHHQNSSPVATAPPRSTHLVRLMDGNDVRLAMQALQLAAQIHDHVWGPAADAAGSDPQHREALLEAATPLYEMAMAAARAIQHRALHSLVKQAVRRYVSPSRGSPDDVLRVILELLTGCGGAAPAPPKRHATRCISDISSGYRGCSTPTTSEESAGSTSVGCSGEGIWRGSAVKPKSTLLECGSSDSADGRSSPSSHYQRVSFGSSSLGGLSSTRSSLDSSASDSSSIRLLRLGSRT